MKKNAKALCWRYWLRRWGRWPNNWATEPWGIKMALICSFIMLVRLWLDFGWNQVRKGEEGEREMIIWLLLALVYVIGVTVFKHQPASGSWFRWKLNCTAIWIIYRRMKISISLLLTHGIILGSRGGKKSPKLRCTRCRNCKCRISFHQVDSHFLLKLTLWSKQTRLAFSCRYLYILQVTLRANSVYFPKLQC